MLELRYEFLCCHQSRLSIDEVSLGFEQLILEYLFHFKFILLCSFVVYYLPLFSCIRFDVPNVANKGNHLTFIIFVI